MEYDLNKYDLDDYDSNHTLKPGTFLALIAIYSSRYILYGPLSLLAGKKGRGSPGAEMDLSFLKLESPMELIMCVPSILVIYAMMRRKPEAPQRVRAIWKNGRWLLLAATALHLGFLLFNVFVAGRPIVTITIISGFIDLYIIHYLFRSTRVRDVFSMFPEEEQEEGG